MKQESHCTTLDTKWTTRFSTVCSGSAAAKRLPISCRKPISDVRTLADESFLLAHGAIPTALVPWLASFEADAAHCSATSLTRNPIFGWDGSKSIGSP